MRGEARGCRDMIGSDKECHEYIRLERIQLVTVSWGPATRVKERVGPDVWWRPPGQHFQNHLVWI